MKDSEKQLLVPSEYVCRKDNIDDILEKTGGMGRYQILMQVLAFLIMVTSAHQALDLYFLADNPPWKCTNSTKFSTMISGSEFCRRNPNKIITQDSVDWHKRCSLTSKEWEYYVSDPETYSIVTEFDLVCSKANLLSLAHSSFFIGSSVASLLIGYLADIYGRKYVFILMTVMSFGTNIATYYVSHAWQFILARMILGALNNGCKNTMYVQVFEFVLPRHRAITSNLVQVSYAVAIYYLAFIAYLVRSWRATLLYTTLPCVLSILALGFYRSPRWLILKQQYREAAEVFQKLGKFNKRPIQVRFQADNDDSDEHKTKSSKTYTILDCFKHKQTLVIFFTILLIQYVSGVIYYTMYLEFNNIGGSTYLVIALAATADIPAMFLASYFPDKYGRKKSFIASLIIIGLCVAPIVFTPQNYAKVVLVRTAAAIAVKIFFSFSADVMMLWTLEIFPTAIRTQGFVMTTMGMSIGSATAPFVVEYVRTWAYVAPFIVIVALCFIGIVLSLLLPETLGVPAREKFEDFFTTVRVDAEKN